MSAMGGMMGGARKKPRKSQAELDRIAKQDAERKANALRGKLVGTDTELVGKEEQKANSEKFQEVVRGLRWVAITGVLDHEKMKANYRDALKNPAVAQPNYRRLDLQRQTLLPDGSWTKWEYVASKENYKILDNLPEEDEELTPDTVRPDGLVDRLPFLWAGLWEKVHIGKLVPKEKKKMPEKAQTAGMMAGGMGMGAMDPSAYGAAMQGQVRNQMSMMGGRGMMGGGGAMMRGGMMGGGMMGGVGESAGNYWKSDEKEVMVRALDFTVDTDTTYRYRVRIVVWNPNLNREDVSPGVDTKSDDLRGPWSEPTDPVTMPPDVMPYATASTAPTPKSDMRVRFQVIRFHPDDGVTVPASFDAAPGEIVGEPRSRDIPVSDGTGAKSKPIDFNSHQVMLDVYGRKRTKGYQYLPEGFSGPPIVAPVVALMLRPDGSVVVHHETDDETNQVRKDMDANYHYEVQQSSKQREHGLGAGMMGMMGGMMGGGMMGGGMRELTHSAISERPRRSAHDPIPYAIWDARLHRAPSGALTRRLIGGPAFWCRLRADRSAPCIFFHFGVRSAEIRTCISGPEGAEMNHRDKRAKFAEDLADESLDGIDQYVEFVLTGATRKGTHRHIFLPSQECHLA